MLILGGGFVNPDFSTSPVQAVLFSFLSLGTGTRSLFRVVLGGLVYRRFPDQKRQNYAITLGRNLSGQNQKEPGSVRTWP